MKAFLVTGLALVAAAPLAGQARDSTARDTLALNEIVVVAARDSVAAKFRARASDRFGPAELARRQLWRLTDALRLLPGIGLVGTGGAGGVASVFVRGTNSNHTLVLIDGIRVNDGTTAPGSLLGGFDFAATDRVEVVRGPTSTLYGGAAIGGTIAIDGTLPVDGIRWGGQAEAGAFGTYRGSLHAGGTDGALGWSLAGSAIDADNERPHNEYDQRTEQIRAQYRVSRSFLLGGTFRGLQQSYTSPGDIRTTNTTPVTDSRFENNLGTVFAEARLASRWSSRLVGGVQGYFASGSSQFDGGPPFESKLKSTRWVADWQHHVTIGRAVTAVAGADFEWTDVVDNDGPKSEHLAAGYGQLTVSPTAPITITGGLRIDDYSSFDRAVTGQVAAAYFVTGTSTKLRASYGSGFLPPGLPDRYGGAFQAPNPSLRPERSRGLDAGVDQFIAGGRGVLSATAFANWITDLIQFESSPDPAGLGMSVNIGRARTAGVELSGRITAGAVDLRAAYTFLSATNESEPVDSLRRLIRRPRHSGSADLVWSPVGRLAVGAGFAAALDRQDTDFNNFPFVRVDPGNYLDARLHAAWRTPGGIVLKLRLENLFDHRYEEAWGFPALGRRITFGLGIDR
jgi:vitamin B12 transporter